jgi:hypothetical protein
VEAALSARVRSATESSRLSERRRNTSAESASGSTTASRSLRQAASAVARASSSPFLRALPLESTRTRAESLDGTSTTDSPSALPTSLPGVGRGRQRSPPPRATLGEPFCPAFEDPQAGAVLREASTLDELASDFVHHCDGESRFVGIDPNEDLHAHANLRFGRISTIVGREGHADFGLCSLIPLLSYYSARRVLYGGTQA